MPARDKTGPRGKGPNTGRGDGGCTNATPQPVNRPRLGLGRRMGKGRRSNW